MSAYWGVACLDCDSELGISGNHCEKEAVKLAEMAPALSRASLCVPPGVMLDAESFGFPCHENGPVPLDWFAKHDGHRISARSEYGDLPGQCWTFVRCPQCDTSLRCTLSADHQDEHSVK